MMSHTLWISQEGVQIDVLNSKSIHPFISFVPLCPIYYIRSMMAQCLDFLLMTKLSIPSLDGWRKGHKKDFIKEKFRDPES